MLSRQRLFAFNVFLSLCILVSGLNVSTESQTARRDSSASREDAYRANNIGVALLEQFKHKEAADEFRRALRLDPSLKIARANLAIALYNVPDVEGAMREARLTAEAMPDTAPPYYLLGLIAKKQNRTADAILAFERVLKVDPKDAATNINLGQLYLQQRKYAEAIRLFRAAIETEPYSVTAAYNLAIALLRSGQRGEGQRVMEQFQKLRESGYGTTLGENYLEQGRYAEAIASTGAEAELVDAAIPQVTFNDATGSVMPASKFKVREWTAAPSVKSSEPLALRRAFNASEWTDAARNDLIASLGGGVTLFDMDGDNDLDLFEVTPFGQRLYRNDNGKFVDATEASGLAFSDSKAIGIAAVAGDYDNDSRADLFVLRYNGSSLYRNQGNGRFKDVTVAAEIPAYSYLSLSAAFVDSDHDGDLDIFIAGFADLNKLLRSNERIVFPDDFPPAQNFLLRNNGNGKFTDITAAAKMTGANENNRAVAVIPTDYDNRRDVDLLVLNYAFAPALFRNERDGTFRDVAAEAGLNYRAYPADTGLANKGQYSCAAAGDVNKDGFTDFFFGSGAEAGIFAMSDGKGRFVLSQSPIAEAVSAAQFLDYDNDGLIDLVAITNKGLRCLRNVGGKWQDVSERAAAPDLLGETSLTIPPHRFASGDVDADGDTDIIVRLASDEIRVARNDGEEPSGSRNASLRVSLAAKVSNRSGIGAKVEIAAGSLRQKIETYSASPAPAPADLVFGLGRRARADAVRVFWPVGIPQAETEIPVARSGSLAVTMTIIEIDRKPSSCPYLYAWNGERFEFVTDFLGGGEMGYLIAPGVYNHPDPDEYVRIPEDQLRERDGRFEIRVTNELEEVLYLDRLQLLAVTHKAGTEVYPNEGMTTPPRRFELFATEGARTPISAVDDAGRDVTDKIARLDRRFADGFLLHKIRGYAEDHSITLNLGESNSTRTLLLLTGWTDYAFSSDNLAAHQSGIQMKPPAIQVKDAQGRWNTVIENIGIPVGRPQTIVVDLTGRFLSSSREVRILTNMRIYWDRILVDTSNAVAPAGLIRLDMVSAQLGWRGFSAEVSPDGREPFSYDYNRVSPLSPWKVMAGRYTREGDVRELLAASDDMFVISRPGDEIAVSFDAARLPPLASGWKRTFLLYSVGFSKEMDINSASPDAVLPLPFHGMKSYPYSAHESYPMTRARRDYIKRYNTRAVSRQIPRIEATFASNKQGKDDN